MLKKLSSLLVVTLLIFSFVGCGNAKGSTSEKTASTDTTATTAATVGSTDATTSDVTSTGKVFTLEELSKFNGKDGAATYIAYKGVVYDLSNVKQWVNGEHNGMKAGVDATKLISKSPHGDKVFKDLPVVGTLE